MKPEETIERFDRFLTERGLSIHATVCGGTALALLGIISRQTRDCDVVQPNLPRDIQEAATSFAAEERRQGRDLQNNWLNNGPGQLADILPEGWHQRVRTVYRGETIKLDTLSGADLLKTKLFALCDRGTDLSDCVALAPSAKDLEEARPWLAKQDINPDWPRHVDTVLDDLARRLGHGL